MKTLRHLLVAATMAWACTAPALAGQATEPVETPVPKTEAEAFLLGARAIFPNMATVLSDMDDSFVKKCGVKPTWSDYKRLARESATYSKALAYLAIAGDKSSLSDVQMGEYQRLLAEGPGVDCKPEALSK
jgi:hypothetical protein